MNDITTILKIESLHRFVFDKLYKQSKTVFTDEDLVKKKEYENLIKIFPSWRDLLKQEYVKTKSPIIKKILKVSGKKTRYGFL